MKRIGSISYFKRKNIKDGIYQVKSGNGNIDIMLSGMEEYKGADKFLIAFSGAVNRDNTIPPYFSGKNLSIESNLPLLAISDPTLDMSYDCSLAWYAGNNKISNLPEAITQIIETISKAKKTTPILLGGSGGGYIALLVASLLKVKSYALVWNPQVDISNYLSSAILKYLETAYPDLYEKNAEKLNIEDDVQKKEIIKEMLAKNNQYYSLTNIKSNELSQVLYLQNISDNHHVRHHAKAYFLSKQWERKSYNTFESGSTVMYIGDWGLGHIPPPREVLNDLIANIGDMRRINLSDSFNEFNSGYVPCFNIDNTDFKNELSYKKVILEGKSCIEIVLKSDFNLQGIQYAIYFIKNNIREKIIWYQNNPVFEVPDIELDSVQLFVRDIWGEVRYSLLSI